MLDISPENIEQFEKHLREGVFLRRRLVTWKGFSKYELDLSCVADREDYGSIKSGKEVLKFQAKTKSRHVGYGTVLRRETKKIFVFNTYPTSYGTFVPACNVDFFVSEVEKMRQRLFALRDEIIDNYDLVVEHVREIYRDIAPHVWAVRLGQKGAPPESFVRDFVRKNIDKYHNRSRIYKSFDLTTRYCNPILATNPYKRVVDIEQHNLEVTVDLYKRVMLRRRAFAHTLKNKVEELPNRKDQGKFKFAMVYLKLWRSLIFYDDQALVILIDNTIREVATNPDRSIPWVCQKLNAIRSHILESEQYPVEMQYVE